MKSWWKLIHILLIVDDPQGILDQQLRPHSIYLLITILIIILILFNYVLLNLNYEIKMMPILS
jgi:hypothetical protein